MQVIVVFNPTSGSGRAEGLARRFMAVLAQRGIAAEGLLSLPARGDDSFPAPGGGPRGASVLAESLAIRIAERLNHGLAGAIGSEAGLGSNRATKRRSCVLVAVGGDGTVRSCIAAAVATGSTLFHLASGNENLFSRQFDWPRDPAAAAMLVADAIERHVHTGAPLGCEINTMDVVSVGPLGVRRAESAAIMVSAGFDADVVAQLDARPRGVPGHMAYLAPIVRTLAGWKPPQLTLKVDGRTVITDQPGWLVVANMPQYALRLNPCQTATPDDGKLDVLFVPMQWIGDCVASVVELARGSIGLIDGARHYQARTVEVLATSLAVQADGDHIFRAEAGGLHGESAGAGIAGADRLSITVHPKPLLVLAPQVAVPRTAQLALAPMGKSAGEAVSLVAAAAAVGSNGRSIHTVVPCP